LIPKIPKTLINVLKNLYKISDDFPYSQLGLVLDQKNLFDLLRVFGGTTLYIPTVKEFTQLLQFCIVEEFGDFETAFSTNSEVLNGFTEIKYHRLANKIYGRPIPTKGEKGSNTGELEPSNRTVE
jgi:hypothetical protein